MLGREFRSHAIEKQSSKRVIAAVIGIFKIAEVPIMWVFRTIMHLAGISAVDAVSKE